MKKYFFIAALLSLAASSCEKEDTNNASIAPKDGAKIAIAFNSPKLETDDSTRAFGDGSTETWEKTVTSGAVLIFNASDKLVYRRDLTAADIIGGAAKPIELVVPGVKVNDECDFALVANRSVPYSVDTKAKLLELTDNDVTQYNGSYADVTAKSLRAEGFVMSGMTPKTIAAGTTPVIIVLKREVAKVEIKAGTTPAFVAKYAPGTVSVNQVTLSLAASDCYLFDRSSSAYTTGGRNYTSTQAPLIGKNRFYIFEQAAAAAGTRVKIHIEATYDADGNEATTGDRVNLPYDLELDGAAGGKILRNGAYFVNAKINGLTGSDVNMTVTLANWETLVTQNIELGK